MKNICPECGQKVKECYQSGWEFSDGEPVVCIGIRGKHFQNMEYLKDWLLEKFEDSHSVVGTYVEQIE